MSIEGETQEFLGYLTDDMDIDIVIPCLDLLAHAERGSSVRGSGP